MQGHVARSGTAPKGLFGCSDKLTLRLKFVTLPFFRELLSPCFRSFPLEAGTANIWSSSALLSLFRILQLKKIQTTHQILYGNSDGLGSDSETNSSVYARHILVLSQQWGGYTCMLCLASNRILLESIVYPLVSSAKTQPWNMWFFKKWSILWCMCRMPWGNHSHT